MEYRQELSLELNSNTAYSTIGAKQGDNNSRVVAIHVLENGVDYNLTEHGVTSAYFRLRKPDGKAIINTATIDFEQNIILIYLSAQALAVAGRGYADVTLMSGSQILSTISFILLIMASPQIAAEATSSNEFGYLNAVVEDATHIIYEAQAWAEGKRGSEPVYGVDSFIPTKDSEVILTLAVDETSFRQKVGSQPGLKRVFDFTYNEGGTWTLVTTTYEGNTTTQNLPDVIGNIGDYGIAYGLIGGAETPDPNDKIIITIEEADKAFNNNAKYYAEQAKDSQEAIENLTVSAESVPDLEHGGRAEVEKTLDPTTEVVNLHFKIPKGDVGDTNFMTFYVGTDEDEVDRDGNSTFGQIVMNRPSELTTEQINFRVNQQTGNLEVLISTEIDGIFKTGNPTIEDINHKIIDTLNIANSYLDPIFPRDMATKSRI